MNKMTFIKQLSDGLKKIGVIDSEEVIKDYEAHFDNELLKGKTEEEISRELGKISDILADFQTDKPKETIKRLSLYSVILSDVFVYIGILSFYLVNLATIILSLGSLLLGLYFIFSMNLLDIIPVMNPLFGQFLGLMFIAIAVLFFGASILLFKFLNVLIKRLGQWHKKVLKGEINGIVITINHYKLIKAIVLWSGLAVIIFMIITYIIGVNLAGNPQFWHEWNWFE